MNDMTMKGWTEDESTDVRTRDLAERRRVIMGGGYVWPAEYGARLHDETEREYPPRDVPRNAYAGTNDTDLPYGIPRRIDWYRVAALTIVALAAAAATAALIVALALVLTAF